MRIRIMTAVAAAAAVALVWTSPASAEDAKELFSKNCAVCHGADMKGHTKMGELKKIPDLTAADVRTKLNRAGIIKVLTEGVKEKDTGKEKMRAFGGKLTEPEMGTLADYVLAGGK